MYTTKRDNAKKLRASSFWLRPNNCLHTDAALRALRTGVWCAPAFGRKVGFNSNTRRSEGEPSRWAVLGTNDHRSVTVVRINFPNSIFRRSNDEKNKALIESLAYQ